MGRDAVGEAAAVFMAQPDLGAVAFDILSPDRPDPVARRAPEPATTFVGCGHMLRRSMVEKVGFYTDFPGPYGAEEKDLCIRLLDRGWRSVFLPGVHVWHDKDARNRDWGAQHRSGTLNDMVFGLLRCPWPHVLYYLPGKALRHARWGLKGSPEERWSGFRGLADFIACAPLYLKQRRPVGRKTFRRFFASGRDSGRKPRDWQGKER
jgi:GT2 family glycosyltransferase